MMMDYITLAGFILAVFGTGVAVGRIVEKMRDWIAGKTMKNIKTQAKTTASGGLCLWHDDFPDHVRKDRQYFLHGKRILCSRRNFTDVLCALTLLLQKSPVNHFCCVDGAAPFHTVYFPVISNPWFMGPLPAPRSSIAPRAPEI